MNNIPNDVFTTGLIMNGSVAGDQPAFSPWFVLRDSFSWAAFPALVEATRAVLQTRRK